MVKSEREFADYLESQKKTYKAQPKTFKFNGMSYRPDFYCLEDDTYYEVKTSFSAGCAIKLLRFKMYHPSLNFKMVSSNGYPYYSSTSGMFFKEMFKRLNFFLSNDILTFPYEYYDEYMRRFSIWKPNQNRGNHRRCFPCSHEKMLTIDNAKKQLGIPNEK